MGQMIVDCHTHLWKAEHWSEQMTKEAEIARGGPADVNVHEEDHWKAMQAVDRAIVLGFRASHVGLVVPNQVIAAYVAQHPEKLIGFASVDPHEPDYLDELHRCFEQWRFKGLKLAPIYQNYHPMDERMQPVYAYCEKHNIPIMFHQGTTFPRLAPLKYASPALLEDVAMRYPELRMVIAHLGHPWIDETIVLIRKQPNVYSDISALFYRPWQFYNGLVSAVEYGAAHKLLLGSDYPFTTPGETIVRLRNVNDTAGNSGLPRIPSDTIEALIERDTLGLLRLS
ncbi:MAG: amidohydrolase family protein [Bryobacteraceae bacterium]